METRSDNLKKVPLALKKRRPTTKEANKKNKLSASSFEKKSVYNLKKKEAPPLTPLHRLQRFKAIRDKNLKSKGFKTSLDKKMEEVTTSTIEFKEKVTINEIVVSDTNGILEQADVKGGIEDHMKICESEPDDSNVPSRLNNEEEENGTIEAPDDGIESQSYLTPKDSELLIDDGIETQLDIDENKIYLESVGESDAVSSISSQQAITNSTDDEDVEVDIIESKPDSEINLKVESTELVNKGEEVNDDYHKESVEQSKPEFLNYSSINSFKYSYGSVSRIYGRRPVRQLTSNRKRKLEESVKNSDNKRHKSPSQPSPRWKFFPTSLNFWTPRTTPFAFPTPTPMKGLSDSMTVNINDDTIHDNMDDSDLFSETNEFCPQSTKKARWGCAVM